MKALQLTNSIPRYAVTRLVGAIHKPAFWGPLAPLRLREVAEPSLPGSDWVRVRSRLSGICGSDIHYIMLPASLVPSAFTSFPCTLGHENMGVVDEVGRDVHGFSGGERVVVNPLLSCVPRGFAPPCAACERGDPTECSRFTEGSLSPGFAIGYCRDTGGGWSRSLVAHQSQLYRLPDSVSDENAVMVEAFNSALHAVARNRPLDGQTVLVVGGGVIGLCTLAALRALGSRARVVMAGRYGFQAELAKSLGADEAWAVRGQDLYRQLAELTGATTVRPLLGKPVLVGGADLTFECSGSDSGLDDSLRLTRAGGTVVMVGLGGIPKGVDLSCLWLKELTLRGVSWYGEEVVDGARVPGFAATLCWMAEGRLDLGRLVTHRFRLEDYRRALAITGDKRRHRVVKSAFSFD